MSPSASIDTENEAREELCQSVAQHKPLCVISALRGLADEAAKQCRSSTGLSQIRQLACMQSMLHLSARQACRKTSTCNISRNKTGAPAAAQGPETCCLGHRGGRPAEMLRQVAQRLAGTARRGISTSAICREGEDKGPKGTLQHGVVKAASMKG